MRPARTLAVALLGLDPAVQTALAFVAPPSGEYCGIVHAKDQTDVGVRFKIASKSDAEISVKVFGLDLYCKEKYRLDPATGELTYERLHDPNSCVRDEFRNFDQDPELVKVLRVPGPDVLRLRTSSGTTILAPDACSNMEETRRRLESGPVFA
uniref:Uncharacterized protein n=1 Tax=Alexandrium catenella TaxID=2925 RepID=A0A7S1WUV4_ALECA|mmetsp:Transcript_91695/g.243645  ORF Transcript_91695/g.243645 Transcript_91695/m.243645 type:complete len:153 (+) Transcript_91695:96-554(+)